MSRKYVIVAPAFLVAAALVLSSFAVDPAQAYRICTFKGTVIDNGWRSMTVKSGEQCADVNVGWRTKFIPNRRPCLGERVAVDFILQEGYMKATKVVSLTPLPPSRECYPPPPPRGTVCRTVPGEEPVRETCPSPGRAICSTRPPAHVTDRAWSPDGKPEGKPEGSSEGRRLTPKAEKLVPKSTKLEKKPTTQQPPSTGAKPQEGAGGETQVHKTYESLTGEVVASAPKSLSVRVSEEGEAAEVVSIRVGLKTKFVPFRRPAVGEKVKIDYLKESGENFGYTVQVVQ
jgi:hypothetical protein